MSKNFRGAGGGWGDIKINFKNFLCHSFVIITKISKIMPQNLKKVQNFVKNLQIFVLCPKILHFFLKYYCALIFIDWKTVPTLFFVIFLPIFEFIISFKKIFLMIFTAYNNEFYFIIWSLNEMS